jgi:hypothetical protein
MKTREDLLSRIPANSICAEIGVFTGQFSEEIIRRIHPKLIYLVDIFTGSVVSGDKNGENIRHVSELYESYFYLFKEYLKNSSVRIYRGAGEHFLSLIPDEYLDFIYIDSNHCYEDTKKEIELSKRKVRIGGFICGHDYTPQFPGVIEAVDEFCKKYNLKLELTTEDKCPSYLIINK